MSERAVRPGFVGLQVKCLNHGCGDHETVRSINLTHLGDGVFHFPTTTGPLGVTQPALICGTCGQAQMAWVTKQTT